MTLDTIASGGRADGDASNRQVVIAAVTNHEPAQSVHLDRLGFFRFWEDQKRINKERRNDYGKSNERQSIQGRRDHHPGAVKGWENGQEHLPKIGGRLRLAHEENEQLTITTEIIKYDEDLAVVRSMTTARMGSFPWS